MTMTESIEAAQPVGDTDAERQRLAAEAADQARELIYMNARPWVLPRKKAGNAALHAIEMDTPQTV